jgi:hypothetical protein
MWNNIHASIAYNGTIMMWWGLKWQQIRFWQYLHMEPWHGAPAMEFWPKKWISPCNSHMLREEQNGINDFRWMYVNITFCGLDVVEIFAMFKYSNHAMHQQGFLVKVYNINVCMYYNEKFAWDMLCKDRIIKIMMVHPHDEGTILSIY